MPSKDRREMHCQQKKPMENYYKDKLSAHRLKRCYDIASPRIQQYLKAEIEHILKKIHSDDTVLELGCGYGRVLYPIAQKAAAAIGIDISFSSLEMAKETLRDLSHWFLIEMNALRLAFRDRTFDCVVCIQNGISAFHVDRKGLIGESVRVTRPGGRVLFSSYSDRFWEERVQWFKAQSEAYLLGEIDYGRTKRGTIVCKNGFTAATVRPEEFLALTKGMNLKVNVEEIDGSSIFYEIAVPLY
jgi:ubiquinone/menaquinone biosynthesis C-methylase UbiE